MPLYEYFCRECDGTFELLRPAREASKAQPCPSCDEDAGRIISTQWSAFIFRDGYNRRLPDDGGYWHLGKKVSKPISGPYDGFNHPELKKPEPSPEPTIEDLERYEVMHEVKREGDLKTQSIIHDGRWDMQEEKFRKQLRRRAPDKVEREKMRILQKISAEDSRAQWSLQQEAYSRARANEKHRRSEGDWVPDSKPSDNEPEW
jgi:putative FmdB family regulatory protein